jgi:CHAT domain-containing protein/tetratricopeptide (TPR) repeat protein
MFPVNRLQVRKRGSLVCVLRYVFVLAILFVAAETGFAQAGANKKSRVVLAEKALAAGARLQQQANSDAAREALKKYKEAAQHFQAAADLAGEVKALKGLAESLEFVGETQELLNAYDRLLALSRQLKDLRAEGEVLGRLCHQHNSLGDNARALDECKLALELGRKTSDERVEAEALSGLGEVAYSHDDLPQALDYYTQSLTLWRRVRDQRGQAQTLMYLGYLHASLREMAKASDFYSQALTLSRAAKDPRGQIQILTAMGFLNARIGEAQESLNLYYQAMNLSRSARCADLEGPLFSGMGYAYNDLGEKRKSLLYYEQALSTYTMLRDRWGQAAVRLTIGMVNHSLGENARALSNYNEALTIYRALGRARTVSQVLREIGLVHDKRGDYSEALKYYRNSLELTRPEKDPREAAYTLNYIGRILERSGETKQALEHYSQALSLNRTARDHLGEAITLVYLAKFHNTLGELETARTNVEQALRISETLRAKVTSQDLRASYFGSVREQFELYTDVLMRLHEKFPAGGFDVVAFEASERARARSLLETLSESRTDIRQGVNEALLQTERELLQQIKTKNERRIQLLATKSSLEELTTLEKELDALAIQLQQVQGQVKVSSPRYAALVQPSPLTLPAIQREVLDSETVLLEYLLGDQRSWVWVVTSNSLKPFALPPRSEIEQAVRRAYQLLTERNRTIQGESDTERRRRLLAADAGYKEAAENLSRMVLAPIAGELGSKRLVVVADGALHYIPFGALPDPSSAITASQAEQPPLIIGHEIVSLPSASVLEFMRKEQHGRPRAPKAVAVLADPVFDKTDERFHALVARGPRKKPRPTEKEPETLARRALRSFAESAGESLPRLPFSRREGKAIIDMVQQGNGLLALDFRASRATAASGELANYRMVHFATHGILNSEHPELSGIILSLIDEKGQAQPGFLELNEIYNLKLSADLVVLSACQTALGKEIRGEGLFGLTRGFMYAGAPRVVASLWQVDDAATADLMREFYAAMLTEGKRPAEALRAAQVRMLKQTQWPSPYYWAAFTLQGEWR